jgi:Trk K+ transport system NAD-binding subunit
VAAVNVDKVAVAVNKLLHKAAAVNVDMVAAAVNKLHQAAVAAVAAVKLTLPRQAPGTFARFFITGAGIWACCAARPKTI